MALTKSIVDYALKVDGEYYGQMQKVTDTKTGIDSKKRLKKSMKFRYMGTDLQPVEKDLTGSAVDYCRGPPGEIVVPTEFKQEMNGVVEERIREEILVYSYTISVINRFAARSFVNSSKCTNR